MKVLFLDIDGVCNSRQYISSLAAQDKWDGPGVKYTPDGKFLQSEMDPKAVNLLNRITTETGAKIVVSSTWRLSYLNDDQGIYRLQDCFLSYGITGDIIGMTPDHVVPFDNILIANGHRGTEIQAWLDENPQVKKFVVLDDETILGFEKYQVKTEFETGLQLHHVKQAIYILEL